MNVTGVEENAQSRFIDYTFATPWESLVSEIEHALKRWINPSETHQIDMEMINNNNAANGSNGLENGEDRNKLSITYLDGKYVLQYFKTIGDDNEDEVAGIRHGTNVSSSGSSNSSINSDLGHMQDLNQKRFIREMRKWFGISNFFVFSPDNKWSTLTTSQRQTLFSALCSAIHSSNCIDHAAFVIPTDVVKFEVTGDLRGYEVKSIATSESDRLCCVVMYESVAFDGIDARHELYYMDGLLRLFDQKLSALSIGTVNVEEAICSMTEIFHYNHDGSPLSQRVLLPFTIDVSEEAKANRSRFGHVYCHHHYLSQLWALFPDYHPLTAATAELEIRIRYMNLKQGSFLDNERYTTFQPSKQGPSSWSVRAGFRPLSSVAIKKIVVEGQLQVSPSTLSSATRRLLAFFIYSYGCSPTDVPMTALLRINKSPEHKVKFSEKALGLSSLAKLSAKSKQMLDEMLSKIPRSSRAPDKAHFMSLVFSHRNRWPLELSEDPTSRSPLQGSLGSLSELIGVAIGSLSIDMQSVAEIWSDCVLELRRHWESDLPIPAVWSPLLSTKISELSIGRFENSEHIPAVRRESIIRPEGGIPFWQRHLWNDRLLQKIESEGNFIFVPDVTQHVFVQKLQLLNLCTILKREDLFVEIPTTLDGKSPATSSYSDLTGKLKLQRRIPLTVDAAAQVKRMEEKFSSNKSRTLNENPLLRWQITHPALVSDIKAYKSAFPSNSLLDFLGWYSAVSGIDVVGELPLPANDSGSETPTTQSDDESGRGGVLTTRAPLGVMDIWTELWAFCDPCPVEEQRGLFRIETEAEKCLAFLEDMSARSLSLQLLQTTLQAVYFMLHNELRPWLATDPLTADSTVAVDVDVPSIEFITSKLMSLRADIEALREVVASFSEDFANSQSARSQTWLPDFLSLVDKIADKVEFLEEFVVQTHEIGTVLMLPSSGPGSRFVTSLCRQLHCVAQTEGDAQSLFELVKFVSRGSESHSWNSEDGRELGKPTKKMFTLQCKSSSRLVDTVSVVDPSSPLMIQVPHIMVAEAEENKLTVSFKFSEVDS